MSLLLTSLRGIEVYSLWCWAFASSRLRIPNMRPNLVALLCALVVGNVSWSAAQDQQLHGEGPPVAVLESPGRDLFPSLGPDGAIAFSRHDGEDWDVFIRHGDGPSINLTADSPVDDWQAELSPDGRLLVFRSERDGGGLWVMNRDGSALRRLTTGGFNPSWSPDGEEIVYSSTQIVMNPAYRPIPGELSVVRVATGERRLLYDAADAVQPRWSPNGERIAFWGFARQGGRRDLWTISASGGPALAVTNDAATNWSPAWSPAGGYLYFASDRRGTMAIWRVSISPSTGQVQSVPEQVTEGTDGIQGHLALSRDGRRLDFAEQTSLPSVETVDFDPESGRVVGDPMPVLDPLVRAFDIAPSPDGRRIAFYARAHTDETPGENIYIAETATGEITQLTRNLPGLRDRGPAWSPDGEQVAFYSDRTGNYEIWRIEADGSDLEQVTRDAAANRSGAMWSPDGEQLLYRERRGLSRDTYLIDPFRAPRDQVLEQLPAIGGSDEYFEASSWSPDGRYLAGARINVNFVSAGELFVYDIASRSFRPLGVAGNRPEWLDDSRRLIYSDDDGRIWYFDPASLTGAREVLSVAPRILDTVRLTADARRIFYLATTTQSGLWQVTVR